DLLQTRGQVALAGVNLAEAVAQLDRAGVRVRGTRGELVGAGDTGLEAGEELTEPDDDLVGARGELGEAVVAAAGVTRPEVLLLELRRLVLRLRRQAGGRCRVDRHCAQLRSRARASGRGETHVTRCGAE